MLQKRDFSPFRLQIYEKSVSLHRVFHSIRFKVNKGWSTAVLLFLCPYFYKLITTCFHFPISQIRDTFRLSFLCPAASQTMRKYQADDAIKSCGRWSSIMRSLRLNRAVVEAESCSRFQPPLHTILKKYYSREKKYFSVCRSTKSPYLCTVFFIVLDLRLTKGWSTAVLLFLCPYFCVHLHQFNHL